jgi:hypothetical protein
MEYPIKGYLSRKQKEKENFNSELEIVTEEYEERKAEAITFLRARSLIS